MVGLAFAHAANSALRPCVSGFKSTAAQVKINEQKNYSAPIQNSKSKIERSLNSLEARKHESTSVNLKS